VSAAGLVLLGLDPGGGLVSIGAAGSNAKSALSATTAQPDGLRPGAGSPTFDCMSASAIVAADAHEAGLLLIRSN
jgi:hypothetical protein